jgi:small subunit ribosomal protein S16
MVKIRLMRMGMKGAPSYRVVIADARSPRDGRIIENIGWYNPLTDPSTINIDTDRAKHWLGVGAQPTESVLSLLKRAGIVERETSTSASTRPATPEKSDTSDKAEKSAKAAKASKK